MSVRSAVEALRGEPSGFVSGLSWIPEPVLDRVAAETDSAGGSASLAALAASIPVDLAFVDAGLSDAAEAVTALHEVDVAAIWAVEGVFSRVARTLGWTETLRATAAEPGVLAARLDEALHEALQSARRARDAGADALLVGDDLAGPAGPFLSPDYVLDALLPAYRRLALEAGEMSVPALFHSDGEIRALLPGLSRAGYAGVHLAGLDADAFEGAAASARRAGLVVLGGIAAATVAGGARAAGEHAARVASSLGTVIVCDDGGITGYDELVEFVAAVGVARDAYRTLQG